MPSPTSYRSSISASSPRCNSFVDQSFHRSALKFSPVGGDYNESRDPFMVREYGHQRNNWQASRLSVITPISWQKSVTLQGVGMGLRSSPWGGLSLPPTSHMDGVWLPRTRARTIDVRR